MHVYKIEDIFFLRYAKILILCNIERIDAHKVIINVIIALISQWNEKIPDAENRMRQLERFGGINRNTTDGQSGGIWQPFNPRKWK